MTILVVIDHAPYGRWSGRESLDIAFALAAFDQPVSLLFRGDGVLWLIPDQDGTALDQKTASKNLGAAAIFGVETLYGDSAAMARYDLLDAISTLPPGTEAVTPDASFYQRFSQVIQL